MTHTNAERSRCLWSQQLLDVPLDRSALATSVRDHPFASNPDGWAAYAATLRAQVPLVRRSLAAHERQSPLTSNVNESEAPARKRPRSLQLKIAR
ncbi:MAG: hypothetical protein EPN57_09260 [Paraburkholderia sp.]|nr:MAG: hypothetical protein EPN57_09260 [Paraburkholderia sp.]